MIVVGSPNPRIASALYSSTPAGGVGVPGTFEFSSFVPVAEYEYWLDDDEPHLTVAAGADGTATVEIAPTRGMTNVLNVRSRTAGGTVSEITQLYFIVDTTPTVSSSTYPYYEYGGGPGVPGEFVLTSRMPGAVESNTASAATRTGSGCRSVRTDGPRSPSRRPPKAGSRSPSTR